MTRGQVFPFRQARRQKSGNSRARWRSVADEFQGDVWPELHPTFSIKPGETIFTIGSCFARNIERHLDSAGCRVPMLDFYLPPEEWSGAPNGAMNKFHPPAFRQSLAWTAAVFDRDGRVSWSDCEPLAFDFGDGRFFDMDMGVTDPVSRERFLERRQHIYDIFSQAFSAHCLMITPGLIEAWRDCATGLYLHEPPTHKAMVADQARWEFEILSYEQCLADMLAAIDAVRSRNPGVKVMVTTSPVPLSATFSGQDVRVANAYSKSMLRTVCGAVTTLRPAVDYFPSYECATLSNPERVWEADRIHVASGFVGKIVAHLLDHYLEAADGAARDQQQAMTFLMNGAFPEAEQAARKAVEAQPDSIDARGVLAEALLRQGKCAQAEVELKTALAAAPDRADLWISLARAVFRGKPPRPQEAVAHVETAAALPSMTLALFRAVRPLVQRKAPWDTAERLTRRLVERFPLHVEAHQFLVDVLVRQDRKADAIEALRRAVALRRAQAPLRIQLAGLLAETGEVEEAEEQVRAALVLEPGNPAAADLKAALETRAPPVPEAARPTPDTPVRRRTWASLFGRG
jgi:tetratricopeptide (TPR) repeat protein